MDNGIYAALTRQSGLMREMRVVANNIANANTNGFRREGVVFAEYLAAQGQSGESLSMAQARGRQVDLRQAVLTQTNGSFDIAIEGDGFFLVETPQGNRLTRAGALIPSAEGELMTADGFRLLDEGEAPILIPAGAGNVAIGADGTFSVNGMPFARAGVFLASENTNLTHDGGTIFAYSGDLTPSEQTSIQQGFLEESNVDPVFEISRMIEVQRSYELGQSFLDREDQRIRSTITALTR